MDGSIEVSSPRTTSIVFSHRIFVRWPVDKRNELADTRTDVAEDAPKSGLGVFRNPDGTRMRSPESVNTMADSEKTEPEKKRQAITAVALKPPRLRLRD